MIDELTSPIYEKIEDGKPLSEGEFLLLFIERLFYLDWEAKGRARGGFDLRFKRISFNGEIKRILIIQPSSIGDVVYTTPLISGLRATYPQAKIYYIVEKTAFEAVKGNPDIDKLILLPRERWVEAFKTRDFKDVLKEVALFIKDLQSIGFDLVINLHASPRCAILTHLVKGRNISGLSVDSSARPMMMGSPWIVHKYYITTNKLMQDLRWLSLPELYMKIGGVDPKVRKQFFPIKDGLIDRMRQKIGIEEGALVIGIVPGANFPSRRWLKDRYAELADRLITHYNAKILILGGKGDVGLGEEIMGKMKGKAVNLTGKTRLGELGAILKLCNHLITNDTGPMHIAGALNTKTIVLAGPTRTGPYGSGHLLLQADLPCVGCGPTSMCTKKDCMEAITVDMVFEVFRYQIGELKSPPVFPSVNLYASNKPSRLFSYAPIKRMDGDAMMDLLSLHLVDLWIIENNKFGLYEDPLTLSEVQDELKRHWVKRALANGKRKLLDHLSRWKDILCEGLNHLETIRDGRNGKELDAYNRLNSRFNKTLGGRFLSFLDILYPVEEFEDQLLRAISLYRLKLEACKRIEEFYL